jgi:hypothetical protein
VSGHTDQKPSLHQGGTRWRPARKEVCEGPSNSNSPRSKNYLTRDIENGLKSENSISGIYLPERFFKRCVGQVIGVRDCEHVLIRRSGPLGGEHVLAFPRAPAWGDGRCCHVPVFPRAASDGSARETMSRSWRRDRARLASKVVTCVCTRNHVAICEARPRARGFQGGIVIRVCTCVCRVPTMANVRICG